MGKERAYIIPSQSDPKLVPYAYHVMHKEPFLAALFRRKQRPLPDGLISKEQMEELING
jgi:hypothetical protein